MKAELDIPGTLQEVVKYFADEDRRAKAFQCIVFLMPESMIHGIC
jgi:hypothetical protein